MMCVYIWFMLYFDFGLYVLEIYSYRHSPIDKLDLYCLLIAQPQRESVNQYKYADYEGHGLFRWQTKTANHSANCSFITVCST